MGKKLNISNWKKGTIVGVVKDFHFDSLHKEIKPLVFYIEPPDFDYFSVKINPAHIPKTIRFLRSKWQDLVPGQEFEYSFLISIELWAFLLAGISAVLIALLTVSYMSIKTAFSNPVETLRYE